MKEWNESKFYGLASKYYDYNQKIILSYLEKDENARLLDIGCNDGTFTLKAGEIIGTKNMHGIDIDKDCIKKARTKGIHARHQDANHRFPYTNRSFDVIISNQSLEHIMDTDNFFREIHRILKPTGYAVISTPSLSSFHNLAFLVVGMNPPGLHLSEIQVGNFLYGTKTHGHIKLFTLPALKDLTRYHGLTIEKKFGVGIYPLPIFLSKIFENIFKRWSVYLGIKVRINKNKPCN